MYFSQVFFSVHLRPTLYPSFGGSLPWAPVAGINHVVGVQSSQAELNLLISDNLSMGGTAHSVMQLPTDLGKHIRIEDTSSGNGLDSIHLSNLLNDNLSNVLSLVTHQVQFLQRIDFTWP